MNKVPAHTVDQEMLAADVWDDEWENRYWDDYWDGVHEGEMSWQWYMFLKQHPTWYPVAISEDYKNIAVANWISETYPSCGFEYERGHFLIEQQEVAVMVALQWS